MNLMKKSISLDDFFPLREVDKVERDRLGKTRPYDWAIAGFEWKLTIANQDDWGGEGDTVGSWFPDRKISEGERCFEEGTENFLIGILSID